MNGNWNKGGTTDHACEYWGDYKDPSHQSDPDPDSAPPYPDGVDLLPDVLVGRISVYNITDTALDSILQKIINYQIATTLPAARMSSWVRPSWAKMPTVRTGLRPCGTVTCRPTGFRAIRCIGKEPKAV
jgi:hypothetical protein